jgi:hypothetical protein
LVISDHSGKPIIQQELNNYLIDGWGKDGLFVVKEKDLAYLNLETGNIQSLDKNLPNVYPEERWKLWHPITLYEPSLSMVVYPTYDSSKSETAIALWDVKNKKEITHVSQGNALSILPEMKPEWTRDGENVVLAAIEKNRTSNQQQRELISISKDGAIKVLMIIPEDIGIIRFSAAPNNNYVAFWSPNPSSSMLESLSLYILDTKNNELTNYCIMSPLLSGSPIWSPDSQQVAVELLQDLENSEVVIVDLEEQLAVKIAEDAMPVGWLK